MPAVAALAPFLFICLWSGAFIAVRAGLPDVSPLYFLSVRFAIAGSVLAVIVSLWQPRRWRELRGRWALTALAGVLMNGGYLSAAYLAMTEITGATMALVGSLQPILVAVLSGPLLGERFGWPQWLGFALGTGGVALVAGVNVLQLDTGAGMAWGLGSVSCMVVGTLLFARYAKGVPAAHANALQLLAAAVFCSVLTLVFEDVRVVWTPASVGTLLYLIFGVSLGGMGLYLYMLNRGAAGKVAANFYLTPGLTAVFGYGLLGETLPPTALAGFAMAMAGLWLVQGRAALAGRARRT
ncbi:MAG: DMT family transporter [Alphaproteobacteria bacterium]|nr:DMT family transporter [Alphaproteobacteria bacterium]MCB9928668.1 DMT family transporter [Alphaproteobacteria bacterium]